MNIERLKKYIRNIEYELEYGEEQNAERVAVNVKCLRSVIDFANEAIARQSVTDEAVRVALSWFTDLDDHEVVLRIKDSPDYTSAMPDTVVQTIITALQAYQPWIPVLENIYCCADYWSYIYGNIFCC